jgi:hypothetical protein
MKNNKYTYPQMEEIIINENTYYDAESVQKLSPIFFKGCRNVREVIKKKAINDENFIYGACKNDEWKATNGSSKKTDKLLFLVDWAKENVPELAEDEEVKHDIEKAPDIINLTDDEKMKDDEGNIVEIEVRGKREHNMCFFLVKDVMEAFNMKNLSVNILDKKSNFVDKEDYTHFVCNILRKSYKSSIKKELYLTYSGLLRVLFASHSKSANKFVKWASETLFVAQMGTKKQKQRLAANILGVDAMAVREVFSKTSTDMPCIYLFRLGSVKELRDIMKIDKKYTDDMIVYKWGMTNNLSRRTGEHIDGFGALNIDPKLIRYNYVDPQYMSTAETDLKNVINGFGFHFTFDTMNELAILNKKNLKEVEKQYDQISRSYMGHVTELVTKNRDLENAMKLIEMTHANKLMEKEVEIQKLQSTMREQELLNTINILKLTKTRDIDDVQNVHDKINPKLIAKKDVGKIKPIKNK